MINVVLTCFSKHTVRWQGVTQYHILLWAVKKYFWKLSSHIYIILQFLSICIDFIWYVYPDKTFLFCFLLFLLLPNMCHKFGPFNGKYSYNQVFSVAGRVTWLLGSHGTDSGTSVCLHEMMYFLRRNKTRWAPTHEELNKRQYS